MFNIIKILIRTTPWKVINVETESKNSLKLLGTKTDNKLLFDKHIVSLCKKAANQLLVIYRLQNRMGKMEKGILINSFVYSSYWSLIWHYSFKKPMRNKI